ncbi:GIY-YIG nuclease family protein [Prosthecodimorpha staleyi]|uniref:GIY-YIG nuclease family protein n=1 Tax=Prosthecodimorpha staleyi TaxID=2840188 RepID=A0A947GIZ7_9HYPH|nr:GIY-YIG nuclease family protein [Prosthecodimorpha staleyi]MBT9290614.1 GIY-YIG nuclease family protein [Prosthecodimorpha staleyi]
MSAWVYILASRKQGTLYVGATTDLAGRMWEHQERINKGFTERYGVSRLVWVSEFATISEALDFEYRIKRWRRNWKIQMIEKDNPDWNDLSANLL